jgi:hypothetical protein
VARGGKLLFTWRPDGAVDNIVTRLSDYRRGFGLNTRFIERFYIQRLTTFYISILQTLLSTVSSSLAVAR